MSREALLAVLNHWWQSGKPDRTGLEELIRRVGLPARFYALANLEGARQSAGSSGPYVFQPSDRDGGWLWCALRPGGEAVLLPGPRAFVAESSREMLQRIVQGCEEVRSQPRFRAASAACRAAPAEKAGEYRIGSKGVVWVTAEFVRTHRKPTGTFGDVSGEGNCPRCINGGGICRGRRSPDAGCTDRARSCGDRLRGDMESRIVSC